jgi:hypothetical protein
MNADKLRALGWIDHAGRATCFEDLCALDCRSTPVRDSSGKVVGAIWNPTRSARSF